MAKPKQLEANEINANLLGASLADWLSDNGKYIVWAILGLFILFTLLFYLYSGNQKKTENEYISAEVEFLSFQRAVMTNKDAEQVDEQFQKLQNALSRLPELHSKYDGEIAQLLYIQNNPSAAEPYADNTLKRVSVNGLDHYGKYAKTTQLIAQNKFDEALAEAKKLREAIVETQESNWEESLYISNLIRIASLEQKLGNYAEELQIWKEIQALAKSETGKAAIRLRKILNDFSIGSVSLLNYIDYREKSLSENL